MKNIITSTASILAIGILTNCGSPQSADQPASAPTANVAGTTAETTRTRTPVSGGFTEGIATISPSGKVKGDVIHFDPTTGKAYKTHSE